MGPHLLPKKERSEGEENTYEKSSIVALSCPLLPRRKWEYSRARNLPGERIQADPGVEDMSLYVLPGP